MNRDIFKKRVNLKPYEYPELLEYMESIRSSYWTHQEFNYTADIQDFKTNVSEIEKEAITRAMMAISQIEVSVKRFWSDIYHYMPKPEVDMVGVSFGESECTLGDTEILTEKGWIRFDTLIKELIKGIKVASFDKDNNNITFEIPKNYIEKDYSGIMHHYLSDETDIMVTEKHDMLFMRHDQKDYLKLPSKDISNTDIKDIGYLYPENGHTATENDRQWRIGDQLSIIRLFFKYDNDGYPYIEIPHVMTSRIDRVESYLNRSNISYTKEILPVDNGKVKANTVKFIIQDERERKSPYHENDFNLDWVLLDDISVGWARAFVEELSYFSLTDREDFNKHIFFSKSNDILSVIQAVCTLAGIPSKIGIINSQEDKYQHITFSISSDLTYQYYPIRKEEEYQGKVYCVEVSTGNIVTRRHGKVAVIGNCRHLDAYANLLELLGLNEMFEKLHEYKPLMARVEYMEKFMRGKNEGEKGFILSMILFSLFVEHISLFSQFVLIMSFNKHRNLFKGMSNAIEATSKEEELHGKFGIALYNIVKEEHPEIFTTEFYQELHQLASDAFKAEMDIIDWIYERGDIPFISKNTIINYIKHRYNNSFVSLGQEKIYEVDETLLKEVSWFDEELISTKEVDFFNKRSIDYSKRGKAITADDLF